MSDVKMISKISVKEVFGDTKLLRKLPELTETIVMRVIGQAISTKRGQKILPDGTPSNWIALHGIFEAINMETGVTVQSTTCYLPNIANNMIVPLVENGKSPQFAMDIIVITDNSTQIGYTFSFKPLVQSEDPLAEIRQKLSEKLSLSEPAMVPMKESSSDESPKPQSKAKVK